MAQRTWVGTAVAIAQIWKGTITTTTTGHTYTLPLTGESGATYTFSYALVAGDTTTTLAAASWAAAWNASTHPFVTPVTASSSGAIITLTADTAGQPFYPGTPAGTGTWSSTGTTTANSGPYDYNSAGNWLEGAVPVADDEVRIQGSVNILYGMDQDGYEVDEFIVGPGYSGTIGALGAPLLVDVQDAAPFEFSSSGTAYISCTASAVSPRIRRTRTASNGAAGLYLTGSAIATLTVESGVVRLELATVTTLLVGNANGTTVYVPTGSTLTTLHNQGGTVVLSVAATTVNNQSGTLTTDGSGAITTVNVDGGTAYLNSSGTITTLNADGGTVDFTGSRTARTVTTTNLRGSVLKLDYGVMTMSTLNYNYPVEISAVA